MSDDDYKQARDRMCKSRQRRKNVSEAEAIVFEAMGKCVDRGISLAELEEALRNSIQLVQEPPEVANRAVLGQFDRSVFDRTTYGPGTIIGPGTYKAG